MRSLLRINVDYSKGRLHLIACDNHIAFPKKERLIGRVMPMSHCEQKAHENGEKGVRSKAKGSSRGRDDDGLENRRSFLCPEKGGPTKGPKHLPGKSIGEGERTKIADGDKSAHECHYS